jgi:hypothetical protein
MRAFSQKPSASLSSVGIVLKVILVDATTAAFLPAPGLPLLGAASSLTAPLALALFSFFLSLFSSFFDSFFSAPSSSAASPASAPSLPFFVYLLFAKSF